MKLSSLLPIVLIGAAVQAAETAPLPRFSNETFYKKGKFDEGKAKDAVIALMKYHGYPVYPDMKKQLWVSDYGTGQFTQVGLAARMWCNNERDRYMLMDLFLLPGQMLPEHWHVASGKNPAKTEGWLVRYGSAHIVGEGTPNLKSGIVIPKCHNNGQVTVRHEVFAKPGTFLQLNRVGAHHWQFAGPAGAIVTEVATVHSDKGVRHLDPAINRNFLAQ